MLYPLLSNFLAEKNKSIVETKYMRAVEELDTAEITEARAKAAEYNEMINSAVEKAYTKDAIKTASENYYDLLNIRGDGIMGYVEIPKIKVELPIFHGTDEDTLDSGVGHLMGSSLPVGGIGTHSILTGHSGLAGRVMFSDLNKLEKGDVFYLHVLDDTLAYMVLEINTVLPEDTSKLTIDKSRDSCTLVTCTPYGVNTHRLLIRGERIPYETAVEQEEQIIEKTDSDVGSTWTEEYVKGLLYGTIGITAIGLLFISSKHARSKRRPRKRGKHEKI